MQPEPIYQDYTHWSAPTGGKGLRGPNETSTLIQRNRERLDRCESEHWSPAASKGHSCPDGVREIHPPLLLLPSVLPLLHFARWTMHQYCVPLTMCCSLTVNEHSFSGRHHPHHPKQQQQRAVYRTSAYTVKIVNIHLVLHLWTNKTPASSLKWSVFMSVVAQWYSLHTRRSHMWLQCTHHFSSVAHMSNCNKWAK